MARVLYATRAGRGDVFVSVYRAGFPLVLRGCLYPAPAVTLLWSAAYLNLCVEAAGSVPSKPLPAEANIHDTCRTGPKTPAIRDVPASILHSLPPLQRRYGWHTLRVGRTFFERTSVGSTFAFVFSKAASLICSSPLCWSLRSPSLLLLFLFLLSAPGVLAVDFNGGARFSFGNLPDLVCQEVRLVGEAFVDDR